MKTTGNRYNYIVLFCLFIVLCMWVWSEYIRYGEHEDFRRTVQEFHKERLQLRIEERILELEDMSHALINCQKGAVE